MPRTSHNSSELSKVEKPASGRFSRQSRMKARTSNACEACKRRKTKCSGFPSPCDVCKKAETYCNFNPKLDTRRKVAYSSSTVQDRQQFMITALLQTIKHASEPDLQQLTGLIRGPSRPDAVAQCLQKHFKVLQSKNILAKVAVDSTDIISFGLQGLCGHRKGRPRPNASEIESSMYSGSSESRRTPDSGTDDEASSISSLAVIEEDDGMDDVIEESPLEIEDNRSFGPYGLGSAEMFDIAVNEPQYHSDLNALELDAQRQSRHNSFSPATEPSMQFFNHNLMPAVRQTEEHPNLYGPGLDLSMHPAYAMLPPAVQVAAGKYIRSQSFDASMTGHNSLEHYYGMTNNRPSMSTPIAAHNFGNLPPQHGGGRYGHPLKSNA